MAGDSASMGAEVIDQAGELESRRGGVRVVGLGQVRLGLVLPGGFFFLHGGTLLFGVLEVFEEVGVEDGGGDFVVPGGPLAEVEDAAAVGAEGEVLVGGEDEFATGGAEEGFGLGVGHGVCSSLTLGGKIRGGKV